MIEPTSEPTAGRPRWSSSQRQVFIRAQLMWRGSVNRQDLVEAFQISANQATMDLRAFDADCPHAMWYDPRSRCYRAGPGLAPATPEETESLLTELRLHAEQLAIASPLLLQPPPVAMAGVPGRRVDPLVLAATLQAIRSGAELTIFYVSASRPEGRLRRICPHALAHDGFRWHIRAGDRDDPVAPFKDFVLGRIQSAQLGGPCTLDPASDQEWHSWWHLIIAPHPGMSAAQKQMMALDYGMTDGQARILVRGANRFYARRRLGLIKGHETLEPQEQQIVLIGEERLQG